MYVFKSEGKAGLERDFQRLQIEEKGKSNPMEGFENMT